ncbi:MAG: hypothetical protein IJS26_01225 [Alphaproteobacteria bacterium]|nr:hypothetical protein [Alphaproteobacteria bacterium]
MYHLSEEQEIARAVALKVNAEFVAMGMTNGESFFEAQKAYNNTLKQRAIHFLKDLDKKIDSLSNQEIADLLRVLIANSTVIESEEELEYYISLLERIAMARVAQVMEKMATGENVQIPDFKGLLELIDALKKAHMRKQPKDRNSPEFLKWQEMMKNFDSAKKIVLQNSGQKRGGTRGGRQGGGGSKQENSSGDDKSRDELISKMVTAGVPPYGPYWNDVLSGFEGANDKADFVATWAVDEQRRDEEKKDQNQNERPKPEKEQETKHEKFDQEKIDDLRMGKRQQNEEKINAEFQNAGNAHAALEAADKKLEKTGQEITDKDIAAIKTKIIGGR